LLPLSPFPLLFLTGAFFSDDELDLLLLDELLELLEESLEEFFFSISAGLSLVR